MISKFFKKLGSYREWIFLSLVLTSAFIVRIWHLGELPGVINGDETASLIHPWQIIFGQLSPFSLTHDGSVPVLVFYPKTLTVLILGIKNSLFAARLTTALFSLSGILVFYLIVRQEIASLAAALTTLLFAFSYWHLNFSRLSWIAVDSVFLGLLFYYLVKKCLEKENTIYFLPAGVCGVLVALSYMGGRIYLLASVFLLFYHFVILRKHKINKLLLLIIAFGIVFSPMAHTIISQKEQYLARAKNLSIFNLTSNYYNYPPNNLTGILAHQLEYVFRGFVIFDSSVSNEGIENQRLLPVHQGAINKLIAVLFYLGLLVGLRKRKGGFFLLIYLLNIFALQLFSVLVPSWSRAIGVLPAIYFFVGLSLEELMNFGNKFKSAKFFSFILMFLTLGIAIYDFNVYWRWVQSDEFLQAQAPAVQITELDQWQETQVGRIKQGESPLSVYEWQMNH